MIKLKITLTRRSQDISRRDRSVEREEGAEEEADLEESGFMFLFRSG